MMVQYYRLSLALCLCIFLISSGNAINFLNIYPRIKLDTKLHTDAGDPLIITPYLKKGSIELARNLSRVSITDKLGFRSHAGFFTIDEKYNSNLYFWYFPPISMKESAPIILWLQGGPGGSSLIGLFMELGPLIAKKDGFALRKYHWALDYHVIFIDNPVGTGFSFTDNEKGYCTNEACISRGLYTGLQQFYQLFPHLRGNKFYLTGESYAGKYLPSLAMTIHQENADSLNKHINLIGIAMGNPYCDPINQLDYGNYLYQHGLIDDNQLKVFLKYQKEIASQISQENWVQADVLMDRLMDGELTNFSYFKSYTGFNYYYNFLQTESLDDMSVYTNLLGNDDVRRNIHVGGLPFSDGDKVRLYLAFEILQSVAPIISELLSHYPIMIYSGQLDIIVAYPLTENALKKLKFSASDEFKTAKRSIWRVGDDVAGYWKTGGNLTEVLVRNAGHLVPKDQPKWALEMIRKFINNNVDFE